MKRSWLLSVILLSSLGVSAAATRMESEGEGSVHVAHLQGVVVNSEGKPVVAAEVSISRNQKPVAATRTDEAGYFDFDRADGLYTLRIQPARYSAATREVIVGEAGTIVMRRNKLYVIVGPGACTDECSSVFTSERDFAKALRRKSGHNN